MMGQKMFISLLILQGFLLIRAKNTPSLVLNYDEADYKILVRGKTLELECNDTANNVIPNWSYPLNFNPPGRMERFSTIARTQLFVRNAGDKDVGTFTCHLNKEGTPEHQSRDIRVIVAPMLKIRQEMQDNNLVLQCLIQAFPSPNIYWKIDFDEKPADLDVPEFNPDSGYKVDKDTELVVNHSMGRYVLSDFDKVSNATLTVIDATSSDFGRYRCVAENEAGQAIATSTYGPDLTIVYIIVPIIVIMITISVVVAYFLHSMSKRMELLYLVV